MKPDYVNDQMLLRQVEKTEACILRCGLIQSPSKCKKQLLRSIDKVGRVAVGEVKGPVCYYDNLTRLWHCDIYVNTKEEKDNERN